MNRYHLRIPNYITPAAQVAGCVNFLKEKTVEAEQLEVRESSLVFLNLENNIIAVYPSQYTIIEKIERI